MIERIQLMVPCVFGANMQELDRLTRLCFIFGSNGTGKTTISRVIAAADAHPNSTIHWKNRTRLETLVYNRDFVSNEFDQPTEMKGVFTLGKEQVEVLEKIRNTKDFIDSQGIELANLKKTLQGPDGNGGKLNDLAKIEEQFKNRFWDRMKKHEKELGLALTGYRNSKERFKAQLLAESVANTSSLEKKDNLEQRTKTLYETDLILELQLSSINFSRLQLFESHPILKKNVIGKADVDISALISKLGNSDWVKEGRQYYNEATRICPFCQQETSMQLAVSLNEYFDDEFEKSMVAINNLEKDYKAESGVVVQQLTELIESSSNFLAVEKLKSLKNDLIFILNDNLHHINLKKKEPSHLVGLSSISSVAKEINAILESANNKIMQHNVLVANLEQERIKLRAEVWRFLIENDLKNDLTDYRDFKSSLTKAIESLNSKISDIERIIDNKTADLHKLEQLTTSIIPTINDINGFLKIFGFKGFKLAISEDELHYKIVRLDGTSAKNTLSEGERAFVTFLYFYHLIKGSEAAGGTNTDKIVVFDDPVSSLDSDICFIVSSLIRQLIEDVRKGNGNIKQIFVLTHNVYFHREVTFRFSDLQAANKPVGIEKTLINPQFWIIRKSETTSIIIPKRGENPIKSSYQLLWEEIKPQNRNSITAPNIMRRIIECYFQIFGNYSKDSIYERFEGEDKILCKSLFSWMNAGSHNPEEDLHVVIDEAMIERLVNVFERIFFETGNPGHYEMMMNG